MDPASIVSLVSGSLGLTLKVGTVIADLHNLKKSFQNAEITFRSLRSECESLKFVVTCVKADLETRLKNEDIVFGDDLVAQVQDKLETSELVLAGLQKELEAITSRDHGLSRDVKIVWETSSLREHENHVRGQILCWTSFLQILAHPTLLAQTQALKAHMPALREISDSVRSIVPSQMSLLSSVTRSNSTASGPIVALEYIPREFDDYLFTSSVYKRNYRTPSMATLTREQSFKASRPNFSRPQPWRYSTVVGLPRLAEDQPAEVAVQCSESDQVTNSSGASTGGSSQITATTQPTEESFDSQSCRMIASTDESPLSSTIRLDLGCDLSTPNSQNTSSATLVESVTQLDARPQSVVGASVWRLFDKVKRHSRRTISDPGSYAGFVQQSSDIEELTDALQKAEKSVPYEISAEDEHVIHRGLCFVQLKIVLAPVRILLHALLDPGVRSNIVSEELAKVFNAPMLPSPERLFTLSNGHQIPVIGQILIPVSLGSGSDILTLFLVVSDQSQPLLLGSEMQKFARAWDTVDIPLQELAEFPRKTFTTQIGEVSFEALPARPHSSVVPERASGRVHMQSGRIQVASQC